MAKRVPPLSSAAIRNLKPGKQTVELVDGAVPGLRVRMTPNGVLTWSLNIRDAKGARRRFDIGRGLGLAEARENADRVRRQVRDGVDPAEEKRVARQRAAAARQGIGTFGSVIGDYFVTGPGQLLTSRREQEKRIRHVFAEHLDQPAVELAPAGLQITADQHPSPSSAARATAYVRPLASWASKRELMRRGFDELETPAAEADQNGGQRFLSAEELAVVLRNLSRKGHDAGARLMLLSGCRLEEACSATWAEFDLESGVWTIPASRRKDTRSRTRKKQVQQVDHVVMLPKQAVDLLGELGPSDGLVFRGGRGGRLQNWDRWSKALASTTGVSGWDRHALRRTTATMAGMAGAPPHVISALLGHRNIGDQLTAGYSKARYVNEVGEVLSMVAHRLDEIESGQFHGPRLPSRGAR
ncbi:MAG: integrase family protein [bacterium]|nr:integrase family protein [bacterium]